MSDYTLPPVWTTPDSAKNGLNQPTAGSRFEQKLPVGSAPFQVYSLDTPNGIKIPILLEELKELGIEEADYDLFKISIGDGDQFGSDFVAINPNAKIPALKDTSGETAIRVFESASILLYLADKFHQFIPQDASERTEVLNWLFWQTGAAPYLAGGFGHFFHYAPEKLAYPINRFTMEIKRQLDLLDKELAHKPYITGDNYTIADIAIWSWYGQLALDQLWDQAGEFLEISSYKHLKRWADEIAKRPAVKRGLTATYRPIH